MEEQYYASIKEKLLKSEIYDKARDYAKDRNKVKVYYETGELLSKAGKEYEVLDDGGKVTHEEAEAKALEEYGKYRLIQDREFLSDFDMFLCESQFYNGKEVK